MKSFDEYKINEINENNSNLELTKMFILNFYKLYHKDNKKQYEELNVSNIEFEEESGEGFSTLYVPFISSEENNETLEDYLVVIEHRKNIINNLEEIIYVVFNKYSIDVFINISESKGKTSIHVSFNIHALLSKPEVINLIKSENSINKFNL